MKNHCGLAWDKVRPWAKRLTWQTQGGRVGEVAARVGRVRSLAFLSSRLTSSPFCLSCPKRE